MKEIISLLAEATKQVQNARHKAAKAGLGRIPQLEDLEKAISDLWTEARLIELHMPEGPPK